MWAQAGHGRAAVVRLKIGRNRRTLTGEGRWQRIPAQQWTQRRRAKSYLLSLSGVLSGTIAPGTREGWRLQVMLLTVVAIIGVAPVPHAAGFSPLAVHHAEAVLYPDRIRSSKRGLAWRLDRRSAGGRGVCDRHSLHMGGAPRRDARPGPPNLRVLHGGNARRTAVRPAEKAGVDSSAGQARNWIKLIGNCGRTLKP